MTDFLPRRIKALAHEHPELRARLMPWLRKASRGPVEVVFDLFKRAVPDMDDETLRDDAEAVVSSLQYAFSKRVEANIERIEGTSNSRRRFVTKSKDMTWSEHDDRGYKDIHYYYEVEYPSRVLFAVNVVMDPRKLLQDVKGDLRYLEAPMKDAEGAAREALSLMDQADFMADVSQDFSKKDVHLREDEGLESDVFDYVWDEAFEDSSIEEDGVEDEIVGTSPENIKTIVRANRKVLPHPSKFGFRLEYEFMVKIDIRGW
jgi:hypothetical protein